jgi:hypothetical protein
MTELLTKLDPDARKARLYPAWLLTVPIGFTITLLLPGSGLEQLAPLALAAGVPFAVTNIVRGQGQRLEKRLVRRWGGMPTTRMLRLTDPTNNPDLLARRRRALEELTSLTLPTADEERHNPGRADKRYGAATRLLIGRLGDNTRTTHPRVYEELTNYGFWRNSLAIRPYALVSLALLLAVDAALAMTGHDLTSVFKSAAVAVLAGLYWVTAVRPHRVRQHGETYAARLLETLDWPAASAPSTSSAPPQS